MVRKYKIHFFGKGHCQLYFTVMFKLLFIYFQVMPTHLQVIDFGGKIGILCLFVILPLNKKIILSITYQMDFSSMKIS